MIFIYCLFGIWAVLCVCAACYDIGLKHGRQNAIVTDKHEEYMRGKADGYYECSVLQTDYATAERQGRLIKLQHPALTRVK